MRRIPSLVVAALTVVATACDTSSSPTSEPLSPELLATLNDTENQNAILYPRTAQPFGASLAEWADRESQWIYGLPAAGNPLLDRTGAQCAVGQAGPVWFLPRIAGPRVFSGSRACTIPFGKAIFLEIGAYVDPWPCPDPNFRPAAGQSLYDFLTADAKAFMDGVNRLDVSIDGRALTTGSPQPAIVDGFFMMFKPLDRGEHLIRVFGTDVRGANKTYLYYLTIA